jgi:SAM-dependent methyltransferase
VIIGSGSASFEMLRYLTERLPVMVTPRWVRTRIQPIAVQDVLRYLVGCATLPPSVHRRFDVGGPDIISYAQMMHRYAEVASLWPRVIIPVPLLTPRLSSLWVGLVTPVPAALARPLVESLRNEVVCADHDIAAYVEDPPGGLVPLGRAIGLALRQIRDGTVNTRWSSATPGTPGDPLPSDPPWTGGSCYLDNRVRSVHVAPETLWRLIEGIGGEQGWYSFPAAWAVRALGPGRAGGAALRRAPRDPSRLLPGDALDFWRVEAIEPGSLLRLRAEMKLPGRAWLELSVRPDRAGRAGRAEYRQRAIFHPRGLIGHAYWWSLRPFHGLVFGGMLRNIVATAERISPGGPLPPDGQVTRALAGHTGQMHEHAHGTEPVFDAGFWNDRYRSARQVWSGNPNPQLVTEVTGQPPGRALDSGCGEGADAIWLARNGWTVVAADISSVAVERGAQHARDADPAASARIEWRQVDLLARPPEAGSFDLVSVQFMQLPPQPRAGLFTALAAAVRPGGRLLVVGHHPTDLATGVARPPMPELFYTADEIAGLLDDSWQVDVSEARPRPALTPEGAEVTIHDAVLVATRRTGTSPPS